VGQRNLRVRLILMSEGDFKLRQPRGDIKKQKPEDSKIPKELEEEWKVKLLLLLPWRGNPWREI